MRNYKCRGGKNHPINKPGTWIQNHKGKKVHRTSIMSKFIMSWENWKCQHNPNGISHTCSLILLSLKQPTKQTVRCYLLLSWPQLNRFSNTSMVWQSLCSLFPKAFPIRHTVKQKQTTPKEGSHTLLHVAAWLAITQMEVLCEANWSSGNVCTHTLRQAHRAACQGGCLKSHQHPEGGHRLDCYNFTIPVGQPLKSALSHQLCHRYIGTSVAFQFTLTPFQQKSDLWVSNNL